MLTNAPTENEFLRSRRIAKRKPPRMEAPRPRFMQHTSCRLQSQCPARNFPGLLPECRSGGRQVGTKNARWLQPPIQFSCRGVNNCEREPSARWGQCLGISQLASRLGDGELPVRVGIRPLGARFANRECVWVSEKWWLFQRHLFH